MYNKEELLSKDISSLENIAKELGVKLGKKDDLETIVYEILDEQAKVEATKNPLGTKRKRTRIVKKDSDRVYSVNGKDGENFDLKKTKSTTEPAPLFKEIKAEPVKEEEPTVVEEEPVKVPKRRGRKSKAELAAMAAAANEESAAGVTPAAEEQQAVSSDEVTETAEKKVRKTRTTRKKAEEVAEAAQSSSDDIMDVPEAEYNQASLTPGEDTPDSELLAKLQEKVQAHNEGYEEKEKEKAEGTTSDVWEGDPNDGTDFIPVVDLPIEDHAVMPSYDMFDNPTTPASSPSAGYPGQLIASQQQYEFEDIITANGVLEIMPDGYGFLRSSDFNYLSSPDDVYVSVAQIKRFGLKTGDVVECHVRPPHEGEKYFPLTSIDMINGRQPSEVRDRIPFEHLTPLFPDEKYTLCGDRAT
ncbi:MAG: transcription termination factor Rho, partial [Prevotella sp.]|nr:transcription termination factor Rho [Prevotella sp.]